MFKRGRYLFFIFCNYITFLNRNLIIVCLSLTQQCVYSVVIDSFHNILTFFTLRCFLCVLPLSRVMTYREHGAWVVKAHLQKETDGHIISVRWVLSPSPLISCSPWWPALTLVTCTDLDPSSLQRQRRRSILWASNAGLHQRAADGEGLDGPGHPPTGQPVCLVRPPKSLHSTNFTRLQDHCVLPQLPVVASSISTFERSRTLNDRNASSDRWDVWELF